MKPALTLVIKPEDAHTTGQRIRVARGHRTQADLAAAIKVSARTIRNWESDTHSPDVESLKGTASVTGWPAIWLFGLENEIDNPDNDPGTESLGVVTRRYQRPVSPVTQLAAAA